MASEGRCVFCLAKRVHDKVGFEEASKLGYLKEHKGACPWVRGKGYVDLPKPRPRRRRPTDIDLRAEVLAGIDRELEQNRQHAARDRNRMAVWTAYRVALRHLREIVELHEQQPRMPQGAFECAECWCPSPCPTLLSLAPDYAPQALKEMEGDK